MKPLSPDRFSLYSSLSSLSGGLTVFTSNSDIQGVSTIVEDRTTLDKVKHRSAVSCPVRLHLKHRRMQSGSGTTDPEAVRHCAGHSRPDKETVRGFQLTTGGGHCPLQTPSGQ